jgi:hypothetical protein
MEDIIRKANPTLSTSSVKAYSKNINMLKKQLAQNANDFKFLEKFALVNKLLDGKAKTTRRNYYNSIIMMLKGSGADESIIKKYQEVRDMLNEHIEEKYKKNIKSKKEEDNWFEWDDLKDLVRKLGVQVRNIRKQENLTMRDKLKIQDWILVSLYTTFPLRNDFKDMKIIKYKIFKKLPEDEQLSKNWLIIHGQNMKFVINDYKTRKTYGTKVLEIPTDLKRKINVWLKYNPTEWFLINNKKQPLSSNGITRYLSAIFRKFWDKNISTTMIRHVYLSDKYGDVKDEMKQDADMMGHSVNTQDKYVKN